MGDAAVQAAFQVRHGRYLVRREEFADPPGIAASGWVDLAAITIHLIKIIVNHSDAKQKIDKCQIELDKNSLTLLRFGVQLLKLYIEMFEEIMEND